MSPGQNATPHAPTLVRAGVLVLRHVVVHFVLGQSGSNESDEQPWAMK